MKKLLFLTLLIAGCSQADPRSIHGIDPVFEPYIQQYLEYKEQPLHTDIPIQFADLEYPKVAVCTRWTSGHRQIEVDKSMWDQLSESVKLETIMHELGHCDLNRGHISSTKGYMPTSIMYPYVFSIPSEMMSYYVSELFNPTFSYSKVGGQYDCVLDL